MPPDEDAERDHGAVRVLVVDDQQPFRSVARTVVALAPGFEVVGEAETGEAATSEAARLEPGMVLMDINLPGVDGIEATRRILARRPSTVVVLLSTYDVGALPAGAATCGAARYVHKEDLSPGVLAEVWSEAQAVG